MKKDLELLKNSEKKIERNNIWISLLNDCNIEKNYTENTSASFNILKYTSKIIKDIIININPNKTNPTRIKAFETQIKTFINITRENNLRRTPLQAHHLQDRWDQKICLLTTAE